MTPKVLRKLAVPMLAAAMLFTAVPETAVIKDPFTVTAEAASKKKQAKKTSAKKSSKKTSKKKTVAVPTDLITDKNVVMKLKKKGSASIRVAGPKNYKISVSDKRLVSFKKVGKKVKVTAKNKTGIAIVRITSSAKGRKSVNQFIVFVDPKKNNSGKMPKYRVTSTTKKWARLGVNSYHSRLDEFLDGSHGVSTKYLNNYLVWNNVCNYCKGDDAEKGGMVLSHILTCPLSIRCRKVADRPAIPALVA